METRHRLFIAVNLAEKIKKELADYQQEIANAFTEGCPVRWTRKDNLHITLVFIGSVSTADLPEYFSLSREAIKRQKSFSFSLDKIGFDQKKKMIWAIGPKNQFLNELKNDLEKALWENESNGFLLPHITLGRINQWQWRQINPEEIPTVEKEIFLDIPVGSIEIMESRLKRGGPEYTILESINL